MLELQVTSTWTLRRAAWSDGTFPSISEGTIPHTYTSMLYCITQTYETTSAMKPNLSSPEQGTAWQTPRRSVSSVPAQSPHCADC